MSRVQIPAEWPVDTWYGFQRHHFTVDGCHAWLVEPECPAPDHRWTWTPQWADSFVPRVGTLALLEHGFYHATIEVFEYRANPRGVEIMSHFQDKLVEMGLSPKVNLIGMSWGGYFSLRYTMEHPERVQAIYLDAPVCDPSDDHPSALGRRQENMTQWNLSAEELRSMPENPMNAADRLVKAGVPIFATVSDSDDVVIPDRNFNPLVKKLAEAGAEVIPVTWDNLTKAKFSPLLGEVKGPKVYLFHRPMWAHHPHGLDDVTPLVTFHWKSRE